MISLSDEGRRRVGLVAVAGAAVSGVLTVGALVLSLGRGDRELTGPYVLLVVLLAVVGLLALRAGQGDLRWSGRVLFGLVSLMLLAFLAGTVQAVAGADATVAYVVGGGFLVSEAALLVTLPVLMLVRVRRVQRAS